MTTLKNLKGTAIQFRDEDPIVLGGAWSSGNALNTARTWLAGAGLQTASLAFGGEEPTTSGKTESYNGTSWSVKAVLTTARYALAGSGTYTA